MQHRFRDPLQLLTIADHKVETVGDKYMAVCGLPEKVEAHTKYMAHLALDIMDATNELEPIDGEKVVVSFQWSSSPERGRSFWPSHLLSRRPAASTAARS